MCGVRRKFSNVRPFAVIDFLTPRSGAPRCLRSRRICVASRTRRTRPTADPSASEYDANGRGMRGDVNSGDGVAEEAAWQYPNAELAAAAGVQSPGCPLDAARTLRCRSPGCEREA